MYVLITNLSNVKIRVCLENMYRESDIIYEAGIHQLEIRRPILYTMYI